MQTQSPHREVTSTRRRAAPRRRIGSSCAGTARHDPAAATRCFEGNLRALLRKHRGKFVLIHSDRIVDVFDTYEASVREGMRLFGGDGFLARKIGSEARDTASVVLSAP